MRTDDLLTQAQAPLGVKSEYKSEYDPSLLCPITRVRSWEQTYSTLPFSGTDLWTAYEVSWLNPRGLPQVALAEFEVPCDSPFIIESKSFKLYLNSFNQTRLPDREELQARLERDLSQAAGARVCVRLFELDQASRKLDGFEGECLDDLDVEIMHYQPAPELLRVRSEAQVQESLYSHLLKSNCPVTGQPDWASIWISYRGRALDREALLAYLVSYREHGDFHEHCVEQIFMDLWERCQPARLTVYARYVRRGGLDINPFRSSEPQAVPVWRLVRQ